MREIELGDSWASVYTDELGEAPTAADARRAVAAALRERGREPWGDMELELFQGGGAALIIARRGEQRTLLVRFESFGDMLCAVAACKGGVPASLGCEGDAWTLLVRCPAEELPAPLLEYGTLSRRTEREALHDMENARTVIPRDAMEIIHTYFT